jgi:hypothetical protein
MTEQGMTEQGMTEQVHLSDQTKGSKFPLAPIMCYFALNTYICMYKPFFENTPSCTGLYVKHFSKGYGALQA